QVTKQGSSAMNMVPLRESLSALCSAPDWMNCEAQSSSLVNPRITMRPILKLFNLNDPGWGRGGGNQYGSEPPRRPGNKPEGPPDLDEVWKDFNNRLGSMFGRKPGRGGGNRGGSGGPSFQAPKGSPKLLGLLAVAGLGVWLATGFMIVQEG